MSSPGFLGRRILSSLKTFIQPFQVRSNVENECRKPMSRKGMNVVGAMFLTPSWSTFGGASRPEALDQHIEDAAARTPGIKGLEWPAESKGTIC